MAPGSFESDKARRAFWEKAETDLQDPEGVRRKYAGGASLFWKIVVGILFLALAACVIFI